MKNVIIVLTEQEKIDLIQEVEKVLFKYGLCIKYADFQTTSDYIELSLTKDFHTPDII